MHDTASLTLAIIGAILTWTASVISLVIWLTGKFRSLEKSFYTELDRRRTSNDLRFEKITTRVQRLEIKAFGFTPVDLNPPED